jgi:hypothetical protein
MDSELPWWTEQEMQEAMALEEIQMQSFISSNYPPPIVDWRQQNQQRNRDDIDLSRRQVLEKYLDRSVKDNEYIDIGNDDGYHNEYIRFLAIDKSKPAESTIRFLNRHFADIQNQDVLMVQAQDYIFIPPRQRPHWSQYEIHENKIDFTPL